MIRGARLSADGLYRYTLTRSWGAAAVASFVMLNPSTADADVDDPTIRRCIGFARSWGCGSLVVVNLYALRSTDPAGLWLAADPVGPDNDEVLAELFAAATGPVVAAWGAGAPADRVAHVTGLGARPLACLGRTKSGSPRHPLYVKGDTVLQPWPG